MVALFDTHCHFDFEPFHNIEAELASAHHVGVVRFLIPSIGLSNWERVNQLSNQYEGIYFSLGLHPYFLEQHQDEHLDLLDEQLQVRSHKCVAVGECGVDLYHDTKSKDRQLRLFDGQIALANRHQLPLILHQRKSHQCMVSTLRKSQFFYGGVIHGFSGSYQQARDWIDLGFAIGVGGTVTYPRAQKTRNTIARIPIDSMVLETDAPDMPMNRYQGKTNHPKYLPEVLHCLSEIKKATKQTIASQLWIKSNSVFDICK